MAGNTCEGTEREEEVDPENTGSMDAKTHTTNHIDRRGNI